VRELKRILQINKGAGEIQKRAERPVLKLGSKEEGVARGSWNKYYEFSKKKEQADVIPPT